jgi:hypothetical protein
MSSPTLHRPQVLLLEGETETVGGLGSSTVESARSVRAVAHIQFRLLRGNPLVTFSCQIFYLIQRDLSLTDSLSVSDDGYTSSLRNPGNRVTSGGRFWENVPHLRLVKAVAKFTVDTLHMISDTGMSICNAQLL